MNNKMKFILAILVIIFMAGCGNISTTKSYTFQISNSDKVKMTLDTSEGYALSQKDGIFAIEKDDTVIVQGMFLTEEEYEQYYELITTTPDIELGENGSLNGNEYWFYIYKGEAGIENTYLLKVSESKTGVLISGIVSQDEVKTVFEKLNFEKVN